MPTFLVKVAAKKRNGLKHELARIAPEKIQAASFAVTELDAMAGIESRCCSFLSIAILHSLLRFLVQKISPSWLNQGRNRDIRGLRLTQQGCIRMRKERNLRGLHYLSQAAFCLTSTKFTIPCRDCPPVFDRLAIGRYSAYF